VNTVFEQNVSPGGDNKKVTVPVGCCVPPKMAVACNGPPPDWAVAVTASDVEAAVTMTAAEG
jgi:hypothetical protein